MPVPLRNNWKLPGASHAPATAHPRPAWRRPLPDTAARSPLHPALLPPLVGSLQPRQLCHPPFPHLAFVKATLAAKKAQAWATEHPPDPRKRRKGWTPPPGPAQVAAPPIGVSCPHAPHEPRCRAPGGCTSRGRAGLPTAGARPLTWRARGRHRETLAACPVLSLGTRAFAGVSVLKVSSGVPELSARSQPDGPRRALRGPTPPRSPPLPGLPQVMVATKPPVAGTSNATTALAIGLGTEN